MIFALRRVICASTAHAWIFIISLFASAKNITSRGSGIYHSKFVPSPLVGENIDKLGDRFVDMTKVYDEEMASIVERIAAENGIAVHRGVMVQVSGPQYETPTEIQMYRTLGADTVGMSTVVEAIAARHMGMRVCVISCVTNMAAGLQEKISHDEVQSSSDGASKNFAVLVGGLLSEIEV